MQYIGLDYHKQYTFATLINKETGEVRQARLSNTPQSIEGFIKCPEESHAVMEASRTWPVLYELLRGKVSSIKLAHPLRVKAIASARIKTDKIDSRILADHLSADLIPEAHIRDADNRSKQAVIRQRAFFVSSRTRVKNRIRVLIDRQPYEVRKTVEGLSDLFGKAGLLWLHEVKELSSADRTLLDQMLMFLDNLNMLISESDKLILKLFNNDSNAQLLYTVPGIGKFLAVLISTEIDDINRFPSGDKLASYTGLVPSTYSSSGITRHGRITKQGNKWLHWAFVEAATTAKRYNAQLNGYYTQIADRSDRNRAKIALSRRMVKITFSMLRKNQPFNEYYIPKTIYKNNPESPSFAY